MNLVFLDGGLKKNQREIRLSNHKTMFVFMVMVLFGVWLPAKSFSAQNASTTTSWNVDSRYYSWSESGGDGKGSQLVTPIILTYQKLTPGHVGIDFGVKTAYMISRNSTPGAKGTVRGLSDTSVNATFTLSQYKVNPWFSFGFNIPTGQDSLEGAEKNALMDANLVEQTRFGEGFNFSPGFGVTIPFATNHVVGLAVSYNFKGKYVPDGDTGYNLNPGDILTSSIQYQFITSKSLFSLGIVFSHETATKLDGIKFYRPGNRLDANAGLTYTFNDGKSFSVGGRYSTVRKNEYYNFLAGTIVQEEDNSNGNTILFYLSYNYPLTNRSAISLGVDYFQRNANSYDAINDLYIPERRKISPDIGFSYLFGTKIKKSIKVKITYFELKDDATPYTVTDTKYKGYNINFSLNYPL